MIDVEGMVEKMNKHLNDVPVVELLADYESKGTEYQVNDGKVVSAWTPRKEEIHG